MGQTDETEAKDPGCPYFHILDFNIVNSLPDHTFGRNIVLIITVTSKKKKKREKVEQEVEPLYVAQ